MSAPSRKWSKTGEAEFSSAPGDPAALAAALGELISNPSERERMGRRGEEIFRARFRLDETIRRFRELYLSLWNEPGAKAGSKAASP